MCAPLCRREPRTYAMVAHCAPAGGAARSRARMGVLRLADEETDAASLWPLPRASQIVDEAGGADDSSPPPAKKA